MCKTNIGTKSLIEINFRACEWMMVLRSTALLFTTEKYAGILQLYVAE